MRLWLTCPASWLPIVLVFSRKIGTAISANMVWLPGATNENGAHCGIGRFLDDVQGKLHVPHEVTGCMFCHPHRLHVALQPKYRAEREISDGLHATAREQGQSCGAQRLDWRKVAALGAGSEPRSMSDREADEERTRQPPRKRVSRNCTLKCAGRTVRGRAAIDRSRRA
ncbi:hypothetical protein N657DRAFT_644094 [Parathielavia appendiculata]|uniref:Secreted protein n=1 Tax=Parathielavia appendiculata TaxID=2587402 RepID=A0AAN6U323_9PEZI|nr:hypothetical protein N657DRAFT_644094 [Parathielavia appendiculata]